MASYCLKAYSSLLSIDQHLWSADFVEDCVLHHEAIAEQKTHHIDDQSQTLESVQVFLKKKLHLRLFQQPILCHCMAFDWKMSDNSDLNVFGDRL